jgi:hypothetical protein
MSADRHEEQLYINDVARRAERRLAALLAPASAPCQCGHSRAGHSSIDGSRTGCLNCRCRDFEYTKESR